MNSYQIRFFVSCTHHILLDDTFYYFNVLYYIYFKQYQNITKIIFQLYTYINTLIKQIL